MLQLFGDLRRQQSGGVPSADTVHDDIEIPQLVVVTDPADYEELKHAAAAALCEAKTTVRNRRVLNAY